MVRCCVKVLTRNKSIYDFLQRLIKIVQQIITDILMHGCFKSRVYVGYWDFGVEYIEKLAKHIIFLSVKMCVQLRIFQLASASTEARVKRWRTN